VAISRSKITLFALVIGAGAWATWDLYGPRSHSLRDVQADEVGRLETEMWRSYYGHQRLLLFRQLAALLRQQYDLPLLRSYRAAYDAAKGAAVFQHGKDRADYERALPDVEAFYRIIRQSSTEQFDPHQAAKLELEWWIVHRQRDRHAPEDLARSLAALQAELYHLPTERFVRHAQLRAEAMLLRDRSAASGAVSEETWREIERMLGASWRAL
jgi:hypothetical protein